jgi:esterase/lipase
MFQSMVEDYLFPLSGKHKEPHRKQSRFRHTFIANPDAYLTILYAHGNNVAVSHVLPLLQELAEHTRCNVMAFEYPGYGVCTGECTRLTLNAATRRAYDELTVKRRTRPEHIVLMGRSVGCAPILWLAAQLHVAHSVVLISAFTSVRDMVLEYPACGLQYFVYAFVDEIYDNETAIQDIRFPVLLIHGELDRLVPSRMAETLYFACASRHKRIHLVPNGDHSEGVWCLAEIDSFIHL